MYNDVVVPSFLICVYIACAVTGNMTWLSVPMAVALGLNLAFNIRSRYVR
jgi:hypothetical protein